MDMPEMPALLRQWFNHITKEMVAEYEQKAKDDGLLVTPEILHSVECALFAASVCVFQISVVRHKFFPDDLEILAWATASVKEMEKVPHAT